MVGVDEFTEALRVAKSYSLIPICQSLNTPLCFEDEVFDLVICKDVFEHLIDPAFTLREIHRVLKPNGELVTHVPNEFRWQTLARIMLLQTGLVNKAWYPDADEWNYPHIRFFSYKGFRRFLEQHGFYIVRDYTYLFNPRWSRLLGLRRLPNLFSSGPVFLCRKRERA